MSQADILSTIAQVTGVGAKHWQPFDEKSPGGVPMTGYICLQESDYLGALALTAIGGKEHFEIIPSMPKIHYPYVEDPHEGTVHVVVPLPINVVDVRFTTKLDGTCIIWYALPDEDGTPMNYRAASRAVSKSQQEKSHAASREESDPTRLKSFHARGSTRCSPPAGGEIGPRC